MQFKFGATICMYICKIHEAFLKKLQPMSVMIWTPNNGSLLVYFLLGDLYKIFVNSTFFIKVFYHFVTRRTRFSSQRHIRRYFIDGNLPDYILLHMAIMSSLMQVMVELATNLVRLLTTFEIVTPN